jgi:MFS family permease
VSAAAGVCLGLYALLPETVGRRSDADEVGDEDRNIQTTNDDENDVNNKADWIQLLTTSSTWRALALCQSGSSFGYACKIAIIPILAANYLPGGITGSGFLLSAAGLAGLIGAPLGGFVTDQFGSRFAASSAGLLSGIALVLIPFGLTLLDNLESTSLLDTMQLTILNNLGGLGPASFVILVLLWSIGASAQGPALIALAQQQAPVGREATALGLPRAAGDATYIIAPLILGYATDVAGSAIPGVACSIAGAAICAGSLVLVFFPSSSVYKQ